MRFIGIVALLLVLFAGGMMTGMMYEPKQHDETTQGFPKSKEEEVEIELAEEVAKENNPNDTLEVEQLNINTEENHFIHKLATSFEKITTTFFEKIINLLYAIAESLF